VDLGADLNADSLFCKSADESSDEQSTSASQTTDTQLKTRLEEYERVICQQQELLFQVIMLVILCVATLTYKVVSTQQPGKPHVLPSTQSFTVLL